MMARAIFAKICYSYIICLSTSPCKLSSLLQFNRAKTTEKKILAGEREDTISI